MESSTFPTPTSPEALKEDSLELYANALELVFRAYERSLDLDIALTVVVLDDSTRIRLIDDPTLQARINLCDARIREDLMLDYRTLSKHAASEAVRITALKELGKTLYPKRFKDNVDPMAGMPKAIRYETIEPLA